MKDYAVTRLRNVVLLGHGSSGKTSLAEAMLFDTGATNRLGRVDDGTAVADYEEEEKQRHISISVAVIPCEWDGHKINVLDTPGYADFVGEVKGALCAAEAALVVVDAASGVEVGTEQVWHYADEHDLPRLVFINKMDRETADFERTLDQLEQHFSVNFVPLQVPVGSQSDFKGVVDLVAMSARLGTSAETGPIPADVQDQIEPYRQQIVEAAAETDDDLIMKYLEGEDLTADEIRQGLKAGVKNMSIVPVLCGSAQNNLGVQPLMKALVDFCPSPAEGPPIRATNPATGEEEILTPDVAAPLAVLVFKTMADPYVGKLSYFRVFSGALESDSRVFNPRSGEEERIGQVYLVCGKEQIPVDQVNPGDLGAVTKLSETGTGDTLCDKGRPVVLPRIKFPTPIYSVAVAPRTKGDSAKMGPTLTRLSEEDPTLRWHQEPSTRQAILSGLGEAHIDVAVRRLESKFGVGVETAIPKVPYRETITRTFATQYRHKKQTGGAGQFAEVHLRVEPLPRGGGFEYVNEIRGGAISSSFIPSIEKGIKQVMEQGAIAGYPVADVLAAVYDGKEHPVDSKDIAFQIAGREVFKLAVQGASPVLLEPIYDFTIIVPEEFMGDVLGDLNTKRARVQGMEQQGRNSIITAQAPLAEMQRYSTDLRSITQGRGIFSMEFSHYEEVPHHLAQEIIEQAKREKEEAR